MHDLCDERSNFIRRGIDIFLWIIDSWGKGVISEYFAGQWIGFRVSIINKKLKTKPKKSVSFFILETMKPKKIWFLLSVTELTERTELHKTLYFVRVCLIYMWCVIYQLLYISLTISLLFISQLLFSKIEKVLSIISTEYVYF